MELHTGVFANLPASLQQDELDRLDAAARLAKEKGLLVNAGHGINYSNVRLLITNPTGTSSILAIRLSHAQFQLVLKMLFV